MAYPILLRRNARALLQLVCALLLAAATAQAQGVSTGTVTGVVRGADDQPMAGTRVRVTEVRTGVTRWRETRANGSFEVSQLPPGDYEVLAEELGYQPELLSRVPVRAGQTMHLAITLERVQLPVNEVDTRPYTGPAEDSRAGAAQHFGRLEVNDLPDPRRELSQLGRYSSVSNSRLDTEGLPGWMTGLAADGVLYSPTRHSQLAAGLWRTEVFPLGDFASAELLTNPLDVEWSEFAGAYLSGYTLRGARRPEVLLYGDWTGGTVTQSDYFSGNDVGTHSFRGGAAVTGPILPDTAHFVVGFEAQRLQTPLPPAWNIDTYDDDLQAVADSYGVNLSPYTWTRVVEEKLGSAYGRFDWQITENHALTMRGNVSSIEIGGNKYDPALGLGQIVSLGSKVEGIDLSAGGILASRFSHTVSQEVRLGIDRTEREYTGTDVLGTRIVDGGLGFGTDPTVPGTFDQLTARLNYAMYLSLGSHRVKGGVAGTYLSAEQRYAYADGGLFVFSGVNGFANATGAFSIAGGTAPFGKFNNWQLAVFLQDTWRAAPGLEILVGLRYEYEELDRDAVARNEDWFERTGIANDAFDRSLSKWSPRIGMRWDVGDRGLWIVRGGWGVYHNLADPGSFAEVVTQDGRITDRAGLGDLGGWPEAPDFDAAPIIGQRLSLLGPEFQGPRTSRVNLGLSRLFADRTAVMISGVYRYTDHLVRRHDLNLNLTPNTLDQYGRPIYGQLVQQGSLLQVQPGTNRRFQDFGLVSALDADGVSNYWAGTVAVERHAGQWLDLTASYTFSWTEDNWLSGRAGGPPVELTPFPDSLNQRDWTKGTSDFDRPHNVVVGAQFRLPLGALSSRVAAYYRYSSGTPFTPGFRDGVDVNGDGSDRNDPAYVDGALAGMDDLLGAWDCLAGQVGRFAQRNSCRGPALHRLDVRFALGLYALFGHPLEIVVDALNLLDTQIGEPDRALYLIDGAGSLQTNPDGTIDVPLQVNRHFGKPLVRNQQGRSLRFGIRMGI